MWSRFYGGSFTDNPAGVIETASNNLIIVGGSDSNDVDITNNKGSYDFWVVKSTKDGDIIWEKSFGGDGRDWLSSITKIGQEGYLLAGNSNSNLSGSKKAQNYGGYDFWAIKISKNGSKM